MIRIDIANEQNDVPVDRTLLNYVKKSIRTTLKNEGYTRGDVSVLLCGEDEIHTLNRDFRGVDAPTDVLSFPMFELTPGKLPASWESYKDPDTGLVPLGDMAISLERAKQQAAEFGHSARREVGYLTIHSILHLLGYDHVDEGPMKKQMRAAEEAILAEIELPR